MKKSIRIFLIAGSTCLLSFQASAEKIYGSVDSNGEVTFSDRKPAEAVEVRGMNVAPEPKPEAVEESRRRTQQMIDEAARTEQQRNARQAQQQTELQAAQQRVKEAEARLREAETVREGDHIGNAGGGSRLRPEYFARVEAARAELEAAKKALKAARNP